MGARKYIGRLQELPTPFYFYDMDLLRSTLATAVSEASRYGYRIHYALKANFDPRIVETIRQAGLGADCVSGNEVRAAIEAGFPAEGIVFAGVGKTDREIEYALGQDIFSFNCESAAEMEAINAIAERMGRRARVALRINPDVDPMTHRYISTGKADNKFGISYTEIDRVIASLKQLEPSGNRRSALSRRIANRTHGGVRSTCANGSTRSARWFRERGIVLRHLNMGGGRRRLRKPRPGADTRLRCLLRRLQPPPRNRAGQTVHFELGRSLVGQCGDLVTRALYGKTTAAGTQVVIVDAGMTDLIRPALYGARHRIENLTSSGKPRTYTVVGPICESSDTFATGIELPETSRGDLLAIRTAGAYGMAMASRYNLRDLPGAVYSDALPTGRQ